MELKCFSLDLSPAEKIYVLFKDVIETYSTHPEKFYPKFYKIVGTLTEFGNLSKNAITLLGFELANQVVCFVKTSSGLNSNESKNMNAIPLSKRERTIIVYLSGYVISNVYRKIRKSKLWESDTSQEKLALLTAGKESEGVSEECYDLVNAKNRGGLWYANKNFIEIFTVTENIFKIETSGDGVKFIKSNKIVEKVMGDGKVKSYYRNVQEEAGILVDKENAINLLEQLITLYVHVRSHSFAKKKIEMHKMECKVKKAKSLRTEMKRSSDMEK